MKPIYLDNSVVARPSPRVVSAMLPYYTELWGASHVPHRGGQRLALPLRDCYEEIYRALGASPADTFLLTSSGAEAVNQVFASQWPRREEESPKKRAFITSALEEAPTLMAIARLEEQGALGIMVEPDGCGVIRAKAVAELINEETALVSLSLANGLLGTLIEVEEIARLCHEKAVPLHLDVTHALGRLDMSFGALQAAYLTFDGGPLHAPAGSGGLLVRGAAPLRPLIVGGLEQGGWRAGTLDMAMMAALTEALNELVEGQDYLAMEGARLRHKLEQGLLQSAVRVRVFFEGQERLPHVSVMAFPGANNEALLFLLDRVGLYASIGGGGFQQLALLLQCCGVDELTAQTALSFSLSRDTTEEQIDTAIELISKAAAQLQGYSMV